MFQSQVSLNQPIQETAPHGLPKESDDPRKLLKTKFEQSSENFNDKAEKNQTKEGKRFEEKKEENQLLEFIPNSEQDSVSFKKLKDLSKSPMEASNMCYIPERNILLVIRKYLERVHVYSTVDFKLVSVVSRTDLTEVHVIKYCQHLNKILVGGDQNCVEIWNPITFKVEKRVFDKTLGSSDYVQNLEYLQEIGRLCVATKTMMLVYDADLNLMYQFKLPWRNGTWRDCRPDLLAISEDRLLMTCSLHTRKFFVVINLKTQTLKEYKNFFIPSTSVIERIGANRFLALVHPNPKLFQFSWRLTKITFDLKTEKFIFSNEIANLPSFVRFVRIENSRYFLAEKRGEFDSYEIYLLWINENKIEIIQRISKYWSGWKEYAMMKDGFSFIHIDSQDHVLISRMKIHQEKN